jgi:hypothetical protein
MCIITAPSPLLGTEPRLPFGSSYLRISQDMGFKPQKSLEWLANEDPPEELPWDAAWPGNHARGETSLPQAEAWGRKRTMLTAHLR